MISKLPLGAVSIPSNIAKGYGRRPTGDYVSFLQIFVGSLYELQTQLEIAKKLEYLTEFEFNFLYENTREIERMLLSLVSKIRSGS